MLIAAFENTSAQKLADKMSNLCPVIALRNSKHESVQQLFKAMDGQRTSHIICFGQKPVIRDKVYIELIGRMGGVEYRTDFDTGLLSEAMKQHGLNVRLSCNAGTSYCNHIYAHGLKRIFENDRHEKLVFIHVPFEKNTTDFSAFSEKLKGSIARFIDHCAE